MAFLSDYPQLNIKQPVRLAQRLSLVGALLIVAGLSACGESRSAQCEKIGTVINASSSQMMSGSGTPNGFSQAEAISTQAANDLSALELGDKKLSNLRSHLVASYRESGSAAAAMNEIAGEDGSVITDSSTDAAFQATVTKFESSMKDFGSVMNATQTYCNGGTVDSSLTDQPAS